MEKSDFFMCWWKIWKAVSTTEYKKKKKGSCDTLFYYSNYFSHNWIDMSQNCEIEAHNCDK